MTFVDEVWSELESRLGSDLRAVTRYDATDSETRVRDDLRDGYTTDHVSSVVDQVILQQLRVDDLAAAFDLGSLLAEVYVFDEAWVLTWPERLPGKSGVVVTIQRDGDATVADVEQALAVLEDASAP